MQFVNDDMDELFRQAAKDYPLKTDSADWDAVLGKMQGKDNSSGIKNQRRKYLFLLFLIPLLIICTTYIQNDSTMGGKVTDGGQHDLKENAEKSTGVIKTNSERETRIYNTDRDATKASETFLVNEDKTMSSSGSKRFITKNNLLITNNNHVDENLSSNFKTTDDKIINLNASDTKEPLNTNSIIDNNNNQQETTNSISATEQNKIDESNNIKTPVERKTVLEKPEDRPESTNSDKKERQSKIKSGKFYLGFQLGPDFSMVKSTKIDGTGYSAGLLAGYNINKRLAVETGLLWDHKRYQSEGRYFNTEKLNWPHVYVLDLSGFCNMFEIPLNLRYNFSQNTRGTLFATAGVSSYLMKKENYDYNYIRYGAYGYGNKEYKNTTNNWMSVAHVSAGIQKKLGAIGDLRVEPYIKLPLHGVGIGSMPLRSAGIYLGITRPIR